MKARTVAESIHWHLEVAAQVKLKRVEHGKVVAVFPLFVSALKTILRYEPSLANVACERTGTGGSVKAFATSTLCWPLAYCTENSLAESPESSRRYSYSPAGKEGSDARSTAVDEARLETVNAAGKSDCEYRVALPEAPEMENNLMLTTMEALGTLSRLMVSMLVTACCSMAEVADILPVIVLQHSVVTLRAESRT